MIHPELELREMASDHRGVFTRNAIRYGETLIRLPLSCAIHGQDMPIEYSVGQGTKRQASTWLRCLAALYRYQRGNSAKNDAYLQSLPHQFETLWSWSQEEVDSFLAGTSACLHVAEIGEDRVNSWYIDVAAVEARYQEHVRPYLEQHCQLNSTYDAFSRACQIISTRAFHLASASQDYSGPFLLPVIDLLNHSAVDPLTTLRFEQGAFIMKAEDNIPAHFEIKHSYGTELTARESLRTFGFVAMEDTLAVLEGTERYSCSIPVIVAKQDVLEACWNVIESSVPQQLAQSMQEMDLDDEAWKMPRDYRNRNTDFLPDNIVIRARYPLSDELVTAASLSFLPLFAYQEVKQFFLEADILDDYFLGKLVSTSLLRVLSDRMAAYKAIYYEGKEFNDDHELLKLLLDVKEDLSLQQKRLVYGLTVRLREKQTWTALRRKVCEILTQLDDEEEETEDDNMKRQRMDVT
ncbi:hypothetical protein FisN_2Lh501 [Fistulifera solaris]|uniref:SET domain-containing protein n=1 Tax=Fistulifera solaris TaxID=1519565 RepID=A0A1Z5JB27_FISSO|nr:hypothetical protein FisN_2Lh501 [Fistulifera solaris]|eukprot:GAX10971.1 hypothetical protein FisN_2Lh501 [Fistulifera solaris]